MVNICVLNFERALQSKVCLESIKLNCKFDHRVIFYNNGGSDADVIYGYYKEGLIDKLILDKVNLGGGQTAEVINNSLTDYTLWIECDCAIAHELDQTHIDKLIELLTSGGFSCIDLTGGICGPNVYSGRSFFINTALYKSIKKDVHGKFGGPGIHSDIPYLEYFIQQYFKDNDLKVAHIRNLLIDNGFNSIRENKDGSLWMHEPDSKKLTLIKGPVKERAIYPFFSDAEWEEVLTTQTWEAGRIPENEKANSFMVPHWH